MFALPFTFEQPVRRSCRGRAFEADLFEEALVIADQASSRCAPRFVEQDDLIALDVTESDAEVVVVADIPSQFHMDEVRVSLDAPRRLLTIMAEAKSTEKTAAAQSGTVVKNREAAVAEETGEQTAAADAEAGAAANEEGHKVDEDEEDVKSMMPVKHLLRERRKWFLARKVTRTVRLPADVDPAAVVGSFHDRTLELRLPKRDPVRVIAIE